MRSMTSTRPSPNESGLERIERREAERRARAEEARVASKRSRDRLKRSLVERVEKEVPRFKSLNVGMTIEVIEAASDAERDILLLAEEAGKNRKSVLEAFPPVQKATRAAYEAERVRGVGMKQAPEESADQGGKERQDNGNQEA